MLERIVLATITTFCIYLFLNLGGKSSNTPNFDVQSRTIPRLIGQVVSWAG